jgi:hypothetical protein
MDSSLIGPSGEVVTCVFIIVLLSNKKYGKSLAVFLKKNKSVAAHAAIHLVVLETKRNMHVIVMYTKLLYNM